VAERRPEVDELSGEGFQLSALLLGWASRAFVANWDAAAFRLLACLLVFGHRGKIFKVIRDQFCPDPTFQDCQDTHRPVYAGCPDLNDVTDPDFSGGFYGLVGDLGMSGGAGGGGERTAFEKPDGPEPFVDSHTCRLIGHEEKVMLMTRLANTETSGH
jgi:hypothetical protein